MDSQALELLISESIQFLSLSNPQLYIFSENTHVYLCFVPASPFPLYPSTVKVEILCDSVIVYITNVRYFDTEIPESLYVRVCSSDDNLLLR